MRSKVVGFLLAGPLGYAVSKSSVFGTFCQAGFEVVAGSTITPGLAEDYEGATVEAIQHHGLEHLSAEQVIDVSDTIICVGWRSLLRSLRASQALFVIHDSLLPRMRGWNPLVSAVELGHDKAGVTLLQADSGIDTGPIVSQQAFQLGSGVRISEAIERASKSTVELLIAFCSDLQLDRLTFHEQRASDASLSPWRDEKDYEVNWNLADVQVQQFILSRGHPYLGARSHVEGKEITIGAAHVRTDLPELVIQSPGKVFGFEGEDPIVACGQGFVQVSDLSDSNGEPFNVTKLRTRFGH